MFIITFFSGVVTIVLGWKRLYNDILSKKVTLPIYAYLIILFFVFLAIIFRPAIKIQPKGYRTIEGESFGVQSVVLDGKRFINCSFDGTELVFKGEAGLEFNSNRLTNIRLTFGGPAARTVFIFRALYREPGFRPFIESAFEQIKSGDIKESTAPSKAADK
jgi:hypothetical protein